MLEFAPGPIQIPDIVKKSLFSESLYFASKEFTELFKTVQIKLQKVFNTENHILVGNGSGSLGMEVAVMSFFSPGDRVAVITSGKYGDNWYEMCNTHNLDVNMLDASYLPQCYSIVKFEEFCRNYAKHMRGIFVTHFETTSGILNPIRIYLEIYRKHGGTGLFIVDAISSLLAEPLCATDYDVVIGASQKALSLPPGLFFMSVNDRALGFASNEESFYYFNLLKEYEYQRKGKSVFTTSVHLIKALDVALSEVLKKGVPSVIFQCYKNSTFLKKELDICCGFQQFPKDGGSAVSVFKYDHSPELVNYCYKEGLLIGSGIRDLYESTFRVRTFGWDLLTYELEVVCGIITYVYSKIEGKY